jgi:predicted lipid-binding transport protein (Tim44 family)
MLIWLVAGAGLGVFLTMTAVMLIVAMDGRAFRRRLRRGTMLSEPAAAPSRLVTATKARPAQAVAPASQARAAAWSPAIVAAKNPPALAASSTKTEVVAAEAAPPGGAPANAPENKTEAPVEVEPVLSVEEMFARAFEAAVPTTPPAKAESV